MEGSNMSKLMRLFCVVLSLLSVEAIADVKVYIHIVNGVQIQCATCAPGTYFISHCDATTRKALCAECPENTYIPRYSLADRCLPCSSSCSFLERERITEKCTSTSDIVCECNHGYFREPGPHGVCRRWTPCPPGKGVVKPGDGYNNTTCQACPPGMFSNSSSLTEPCHSCSKCQEGEITDSECNSTTDTVCTIADGEATRMPGSGQTDGVNPAVLPVVIVVVVLVVALLVVILFCCCTRKGQSVKDKLKQTIRNRRNDSENCNDAEARPLTTISDQNGHANGHAQRNGHLQNGTAVANGNTGIGVNPGREDQVNPVLRRISSLVVKNFKMLFRILNLTDLEIERAEVEYGKSIEETQYQLFKKYYEKKHVSLEEMRKEILQAVTDFDSQNRVLLEEFERALKPWEGS